MKKGIEINLNNNKKVKMEKKGKKENTDIIVLNKQNKKDKKKDKVIEDNKVNKKDKKKDK